MPQPEVSILLSTYNGSRYLKEQLDSIGSQTFKNWLLLIRDDGSFDETLAIIEDFSAKNPSKVVLVKDELGNLGAKMSYNQLLQKTNTEYLAFCDQDDSWKPEKLELLIAEMKKREQICGKNFPILVHHDLAIANDKLEIISPSFYEYSGLSPDYAQRNTILWRNVIPGCSMLINAALAKRAGEIPSEAVMHDYWIILFAHYCGKIFFIPQALTLYRQHGSNSLGAEKSTNKKSWKTVFRNWRTFRKNSKGYLQKFLPYQKQAAAFVNRFPADEKNVEPVRAFLALTEKTKRSRRKWLVISQNLKAGNLRETAELLFCC